MTKASVMMWCVLLIRYRTFCELILSKKLVFSCFFSSVLEISLFRCVWNRFARLCCSALGSSAKSEPAFAKTMTGSMITWSYWLKSASGLIYWSKLSPSLPCLSVDSLSRKPLRLLLFRSRACLVSVQDASNIRAKKLKRNFYTNIRFFSLLNV